MILSMTAFASSTAHSEGFNLQWELRSVNHRFLEPHFRLPESARNLETPLRDIVRSKLRRGKVDCNLKLEVSQEGELAQLNRPALLQLLALFEQIRRDAPEVKDPNPLDILRWPGVLLEAGIDENVFRKTALKTFEEALLQLEEHRAREGAKLKLLVEERLTDVEHLVKQVRNLTSDLAQAQRAQLQAKLAKLDVRVDPERLEQEIVLLVQKSDVDEELDRLEIHVAETRESLNREGPHGRRLDFLMQELNREANTLASKSILAETAQCAVDLKVTIEQIREQIQNIE